MKFSILTGLLFYSTLFPSFAQQLMENEQWAMDQPYVILISIDGFRHDYAEKYGAATLLDIKKKGTSAESMIPSFPSKTFPNHYTLVTGMYPAKHGIIGNSFHSRSKNATYRLGDKSTVLDSSWYGGKPIWSLANDNGMLTASYFWVGSETPIGGDRPTYWKSYDDSVPNEQRTAQVLDWLKLSAEKRPHLITLYFSLVDDAGHIFGPDANEVKDAVLKIDELIGAFREEVKGLNLPITLIVTADHGMAATNRAVALNDIDFKDAVVDLSSTMVMVYHDKPEVLAEISIALKMKSLLQVYTKEEMKDKFGFDNDDRVGDLIGLVEPPFQIVNNPKSIGGGTHGYDPDSIKEMHTIFMCEGPSIKTNYQIAPFRNVHVYPLLAKLLNLPIPVNIDGEITVLEECILN